MKNLTLVLLVVGTLFAVIPAHVAYAGPYEDCLAGRAPYAKPGTEASCSSVKTSFPVSGGTKASTPGGRENTEAQPGSRENIGTGALPGGRENAGDSSRGDLSYSLQNPLAFDSIQGFIVAILNIIIVIATPIVVIFIVLAGFKYVTARGDASKVQEATRALTYSVIGGVLIIGAVAIAEIIKNLITAFGT